ncbi:GDSL-like Lipase/Acylhydrolase [uncultured Clostridium sp.]|nr:GDSL-like Lipase/Acylhydrolase [uncultured Clostridium sp.]
MTNVAVWGDSISKGILYDSERKRHVILPKGGIQAAAECLGLRLQNFSRFGATISKGWERLQKSLSQGVNYDLALLEYGGNDCDYDWSQIAADPEGDYLPFTPLEQFKKIYQDMIAAFKERGVTPAVMNLPPIDSRRYLQFITRNGLSAQNILKWLGDVEHIHRHQAAYSQVVEQIALENGCYLVDVRQGFFDAGDYRALLCEDGIHPNLEGQRCIQHQLVGYAHAMGI